MNKPLHPISKAWQLLIVLICYACFGIGMSVMGLCFALLSLFPLPSQATKQRWIRACIHNGCLSFICLLRLVGLLRYSYHLQNTLSPPVTGAHGHILVANHPTLIDAIMMFAAHKNLCCFVKGALWHNILTGPVARLAGFIPNHTIEAIDMAVDKLHAGEDLLIFPEGTRTLEDQAFAFKRGAANIAVAARVTIRPILIKCQPPTLKKGDKWYKIPDGGASFALQEAPLLSLEQCINTMKPAPIQYRAFTRFLEQFYQQWIALGQSASPDEIQDIIHQLRSEQKL